MQGSDYITGTDEIHLPFDFNQHYQGYYPFCSFQRTIVLENLQYLAGTDPSGIVHVFTSTDGEVWSEINICPTLWPGANAEYGEVVEFIFYKKSRQLFLVTSNGFLVTIPDCPKCVRSRRLMSQKIESVRLHEYQIELTDIFGRVRNYPLRAAMQYRCSYDFAKQYIGREGLMIDLRQKGEGNLEVIPGALVLTEEEAMDLVKHCGRKNYFFFLCEKGTRADALAEEASELGYEHVYSLGGIGDIKVNI